MQTQYKIYLLSTAFFLAAASMVGFLIIPLLRGIQVAAFEIALDKERTASFELQNVQLHAFKEHYQAYKPGLEKIAGMFIDAKNPVAFIEFLERASRDADITADIAIIAPPKNATPSTVATFHITATGRFTNMVRFSQVLEKGSYLIAVRNLALTNKAEELASAPTAPKNLLTADFLIEVMTK